MEFNKILLVFLLLIQMLFITSCDNQKDETIVKNAYISNEIMVNDKKITLDQEVWESDQTIEIDRSANNLYELTLPEGASIYRWKTGEINPVHDERIRYIFDENLEGLSFYAQKYTFKLDDDASGFEIKLINIDDLNENYDKVDGKIFKFYLK